MITSITYSRANAVAEDEKPMKLVDSNNSADGAGSGCFSLWPAPGFLFGYGYPVERWDVVSEVRHGGTPVEGKKVNGFLKRSASFRRRRYRFVRCGVAERQMGYALQLRRGATEFGVRLPGSVSKAAVLDNPDAVSKAGCHKNPRPNGRYSQRCCRFAADCHNVLFRRYAVEQQVAETGTRLSWEEVRKE